MKITIDTKEDSKDEIKRIISFLHHLVGSEAIQVTEEPPKNQDIFSNDAPTENAFASMFGNSSESQQPAEAAEQVESSEPEEKPDNIEIVPYM
jgi:hypothetical protein